MRLLESARDPLPDLDLHGSAQPVLDWFCKHAEQLERHVPAEPDTSMAGRRKGALDVLRAAVRRDEVAEDEGIVSRPLSPERICDFVADIYASRFSANVIERLFAGVGAFRYLASDASDAPELRWRGRLERKGPLTETPEHARTHYGPYGDDSWGEGLGQDVAQRFCEALDEAPSVAAPLDSAEDVLRAVDAALAELEPCDGVIVLLAGDWSSVLNTLQMERPDGFEPWRSDGAG